jgi:hypothetical protein
MIGKSRKKRAGSTSSSTGALVSDPSLVRGFERLKVDHFADFNTVALLG